MQKDLTFQELCDWYFETIAPLVLKPNIREGIYRDMKNHVLPVLAEKPVSAITPLMLDRLFYDLSQSGNLRRTFSVKTREAFSHKNRSELSEESGVSESTIYNLLGGNRVEERTAEKLAGAMNRDVEQLFVETTEKRGLSGASVNKLKRALSAMLSVAVRKGIIEKNVCSLTTAPKIDTKPAAFLDETECQELLTLLRNQKDRQFQVIISILLTTGMRSGELLALYWEDAVLRTGELRIRYTLVKENGVWTRQPPKTRGSERYVKLPEEVGMLLRKHRKAQLEKRLMCGGEWENRDLIFTNQRGGYLTNAQLNKQLKRLVAGSGLPQDIHLHSLRHTYASLLINADVAARVVADRLGHATVRTTLDIYGHVFRRSEEQTVDAIERALFMACSSRREHSQPQ